MLLAQSVPSIPHHLPPGLSTLLSWLIVVVILLTAIPSIWLRLLSPLLAGLISMLRIMTSLRGMEHHLVEITTKGPEGSLVEQVTALRNVVQKHSHSLAELRSQLEALYGAGTTPMFLCKLDGGNTFVNRAYADMLKCSRKDLMGVGWRSFFTQHDLRRYDTATRDAAEEGREYKVETTLKDADEQSVHVRIEAYPYEDETEKVIGYHGVLIVQPQR